MNISPEKINTAMTPAKRNIRIRIDKQKATKLRLEKELSRPKMLIEEYQETLKPSSYYVEIAKQRFKSLQESKSSRQILSRSNKASSNSSRTKRGLKLSELSTPIQDNYQIDIIPKWLQDRPDFQESVKNLEIVRNKRVPLVLDLEYHNRTSEDKEILRDFLASVKFFERLPTQVISDASNRLIKEIFKENELIVKKGDPADSLIIFYEGSARVVFAGMVVAEKGPKDVVGDTSLDYRMPRSADVIANNLCIVFKLMREDYEAAVLHTKRLEKQENLEYFANMPIFNGWNQLKLNRLSSVFNIKQFEKNTVVYQRGDPSLSIFFVKQGKVEIFAYVPLEKSNKWPVSVNKWIVRQVNKEYLVKLTELKAGQYFGEVELIEGRARSMKAVTLKNCTLLELNKDQVYEFFYDKNLDSLLKHSSTKHSDVKTLQNKLKSEISSRIVSENALLDALKVDFSNLHGRDSLLDPKIKKLNNWLSSYRSRRTESSKTFKDKIVYENSKDISVDKIKKSIN